MIHFDSLRAQWRLAITSTHEEHTLWQHRRTLLAISTCLSGPLPHPARRAGSISRPRTSTVVSDISITTDGDEPAPPFLIFPFRVSRAPTPSTSSAANSFDSSFFSSQAILLQCLRLAVSASRVPQRALPSRVDSLLPCAGQDQVAWRSYFENRKRGLAEQAEVHYRGPWERFHVPLRE